MLQKLKGSQASTANALLTFSNASDKTLVFWLVRSTSPRTNRELAPYFVHRVTQRPQIGISKYYIAEWLA
ncbi:MAG: hypothetical protein DMG40_00465 [Acidobacteria bacterium]|nr:MAG: hypothetical protein DMG40_00465 [Acidobacteriota bacterium]